MINQEDFSQLDEIDLKATGQKIKFLAKNAGFSQSELARILGRDPKTISNYYCGISLPDKIDFIILSRILGKSYDEILVYKGDLEGYRRVDRYILEYTYGHDNLSEVIDKTRTESKLFNPYTKGRANIRTFEEAGYCLEFFNDYTQQDLKNRMMDELFSGGSVNGNYMYHIFESYIWRRLSDEQKAECKKEFTRWRGE